MTHNLMFVDYALGQPGSVHDTYAFQGTWMVQNPAGIVPPQHWIWADVVYPCETWCAVPFKKPHGGSLTGRQNTYNRYLSKVCLVCFMWYDAIFLNFARYACGSNMHLQP